MEIQAKSADRNLLLELKGELDPSALQNKQQPFVQMTHCCYSSGIQKKPHSLVWSSYVASFI